MGLRQRLLRLPLFNRVLLGNSLVIVAGAVGGTLLTRHLAITQDLWLIVLFAAAGILLSLLVNYLVIRSALRPLEQLRAMVELIQAGAAGLEPAAFAGADHDTLRLAQAVDSMLARLEDHRRQLRALSQRALAAQEDERKRIARNLHDDTGQSLSTLIIELERLEVRPPADAQALRARLTAARALATRTLEDLRTLVLGLRPSMLDDLGLVPAIRWYARSQLEPTGLRLELALPEAGPRLESEIETALFRIAQEAIHNIQRHAAARTVRIALREGPGALVLEVEDDGCGFEPRAAPSRPAAAPRLGLLGMRERAELAGGALEVESAPGRGTRLRVRVPQALPLEAAGVR